ncbi:MAG: DUF4276 family protein [Chthoniobacteraceae bacterium]|jgi:hypothetical protein
MIQPIVEGHGEVEAVPVLIRRLAQLMGVHQVDIGKPIRRPRSDFLDPHKLERAVELACLKPGCKAVFVIFDADDDCPREAAPPVLSRTEAVAAGRACSVVIPTREFEAWFLASLPTLKGHRGIIDVTPLDRNPESIRGAKGELERRMQRGRGYNERNDQPALIQATDWSLVNDGTRSGRKLIKEMRRLLSSLGHELTAWPQPI